MQLNLQASIKKYMQQLVFGFELNYETTFVYKTFLLGIYNEFRINLLNLK